ncbi:MAG: ribonuclease III [Chlamydiia bacterium]|nr:ribonuclease III [Chlamydiia bacterium]
MNTRDHLKQALPLIEKEIRYTFRDKSLLELAFIHRSYANENQKDTPEHNERLEFLGDAVLGIIVSDFLYKTLPNHPEGELSYLRSRLVEATVCTRYVQKIGSERFLLLGKGEAMNAGKGRATLLADLFEALMGAIYLDGGIEPAREFFFDFFEQEVQEIIEKPHRNFKAELQDYCQKRAQKPPQYEIVSEEGPDHMKTFFVEVSLDGKKLGSGEGQSKKQAEQQAAENAMQRIES